MKKYIILLLFSFTAVAQEAEFRTCNGVLTNKPCDKVGKNPSLTRNSSQAKNVEDSKKESLIHDLRILNINAKRDFNINYNIEIAEQECKESSLLECNKIVKNANKELKEMINNEKIIKLKQSELENKTKKAEDDTVVVIRNNNVIIPKIIPRKNIPRSGIQGGNIKEEDLKNKIIPGKNTRRSLRPPRVIIPRKFPLNTKNSPKNSLPLNKNQNFSSPTNVK